MTQRQPRNRDAFFDYILARSRARESSTLTIATVAASASLVLIVLFIQAEEVVTDNQLKVIAATGLAFALVGLLYRIITAHSIQNKDETLIKQYLTEDQIRESSFPLASGVRQALLYILLGIPIFVWSVILILHL